MIKKTLLLLLTVALLIACSKNEDEQNPNLHIDKSSVSLSSGNPYAAVHITKGSGNYYVVSSNESVALSFVKGETLYIAGNEIGNAIVTLSDEAGNSVRIKAEVKTYISRPIPLLMRIVLKKEDTKLIPVTNTNDGFAIQSSNNSIQVKQNDNNISITGSVLGTSTLYYFENYWLKEAYDVQIIDHYQLTLITNSSAISFYQGQERELYISSGNGTYTLTTDEKVLSAKLQPWPTTAPLTYNHPAVILCKGLAPGNTTLTITDNETGESKSFAIRVY